MLSNNSASLLQFHVQCSCKQEVNENKQRSKTFSFQNAMYIIADRHQYNGRTLYINDT